MSNFTHRIAWDTPYCYTEVTYDTDEVMTDEIMQSLANHAVSMEAAMLEVGGGPRQYSPAGQEAMANGAVPVAGNLPSNNVSGKTCKNCGGPTKAGDWRNGQYGVSRPLECLSGCLNEKGYPLATWEKKK